MDIPRIFNITESAHRIHNPITPEKLATLGVALRLESGNRVLDLGSGSGEMLCTWARPHVLPVFGGLKNKNMLGLTINNVSSPQEKDERIPNTKYIH